MNELANVLDELVADAPIASASWSDVQTRSRRRRSTILRLQRRQKRFVLPLAAGALLVLAGAAVGVGVDLLGQQERFHASAPNHPGRLGPLVEVTASDDWASIAWRSEAGVCLDFAISNNSPFSCDFPVRGAKPATDTSASGTPTHAVAGVVNGGGLVGGDGKTTIFGVAARDVAIVEVELRDGRVVGATLYDAPPELGVELRIFIVRLSLPSQGLSGEGPVRAYRAYGRDGRLIERVVD